MRRGLGLRKRLHLAACRVGIHDWRYFIDGDVCRACVQCHAVQYGLPGVGQ